MKVVGLTGGIASGKSSVSTYLSSLGAMIIDADAVSANVLEKEKLALIPMFGEDAVHDGIINKVYLRQEIFKHPEKKKALEKLIHGNVKETIASQIDLCKKENKVALVVVEVPLLFEAGWEGMFDTIWTVSADEKIRIERLLQRQGMNEHLAKKIMAQQWQDIEREKKADKIICNGGSWSELRKQLEDLHQIYT